MTKRWKDILHELEHHFPFTVMAVFIAIILMAGYTELLRLTMVRGGGQIDICGHAGEINPFTRLFHILHPVHVFLSAAATSAMFWRYDKRLLVAIITGALGSVVVCGISDIIFPFIGGLFLNKDMHFHLCLIEDPATVLTSATVGIVCGIGAASGINTSSVSKAAHGMHVLTSTGATLLYLVGFGFFDWSEHLMAVFSLVTLSVVIPCCTSDIIFPLMLVNPKGVHMCLGNCHHDAEE